MSWTHICRLSKLNLAHYQSKTLAKKLETRISANKHRVSFNKDRMKTKCCKGPRESQNRAPWRRTRAFTKPACPALILRTAQHVLCTKLLAERMSECRHTRRACQNCSIRTSDRIFFRAMRAMIWVAHGPHENKRRPNEQLRKLWSESCVLCYSMCLTKSIKARPTTIGHVRAQACRSWRVHVRTALSGKC